MRCMFRRAGESSGRRFRLTLQKGVCSRLPAGRCSKPEPDRASGSFFVPRHRAMEQAREIGQEVVVVE
jgi:hypothetical protein